MAQHQPVHQYINQALVLLTAVIMLVGCSHAPTDPVDHQAGYGDEYLSLYDVSLYRKDLGLYAEQGVFDRTLAEGYLRLAKQELNVRDYHSAELFKQRGLAVLSGQPVGPEPLEARRLPAHAVDELAQARDYLVTLILAGAADAFPVDTARAQVLFDCWMEQQEENFQQPDIAACQRDFYDAIAGIRLCDNDAGACGRPDCEPGGEPCADAIEIRSAPPVAEPLMPGTMNKVPQAPFLLYFDFDSTALVASSEPVFEVLVQAIGQYQPASIQVTGHTDLAGAPGYNWELSRQRLAAVVDALAARGIANVSIEGDYFGQTRPAVETPDGQPLQANRRVEVRLR